MKVSSIQSPTFGIRQKETILKDSKDKVVITQGSINSKHVTIFNQYHENNLTTKLIYLQDKFLNLLKFKLIRFVDGKKQQLIKQTKI